ncbi:MAG TPA: cupredoxin domain-containing protein [Gemmatimonadaceae bacterium]|nr:cupredoxin domain-containing protein [Gemmatimonadaceae bacterium]
MTAGDWIVIAAASAAIAWVNWYFFFAERSSATAAATVSGAQEVEIVVKGGYTPSEIHAKEGTPLRLVFDRQETSSCSDEIVIGDFGIRKFLPAFQKTVVELTPTRPGRFEFTCGMGMLHGALVVGS